jgi:uncharacterized membrane protein YcjF (UPF0283 family)
MKEVIWMQKRYRSLIFALIIAIIATLFIVLTNVAKDYIIIHFHYRSWSNLTWAARGFAAVSYLFLIARAVVVLLDKIKQAQSQRTRVEQEAERMQERKLRTPEDIKAFLSGIGYMGLVTELIDQLSKMDEYQERLNRLFEINDIDSFSNIIPLFQQVENEICDNCRTAINHYVAGGKEEFVDSAEEVVKQNDQLLERIQTVLKALANYISGQVTRDGVSEVLDEFVQALATVQKNEG